MATSITFRKWSVIIAIARCHRLALSNTHNYSQLT